MRLNEFLASDLHTSSQSDKEMEGGIHLDVVVGDGSSILKLLPFKDKSLRIDVNSQSFVNLGFDAVDCVKWLHSKGDGQPGQSFHLDLNLRRASFGTVDLLEVGTFGNVIICKLPFIEQRLTDKEQWQIIARHSLLFHDLFLETLNCGVWLDLD